MTTELLNKLRMQKKFRNLKAIQKLPENATQLEEYLTGQVQPQNDADSGFDGFSSDGYNIHVDKDFHYLLEAESGSPTRISGSRSSGEKLSIQIEDNFYYQHMFNFALVVILLLQVIVVWAFIWCRLSKYGNQPINHSRGNHHEDGIALRDIAHLPEVIPQQFQRNGEQNDNREAANRCGRFG